MKKHIALAIVPVLASVVGCTLERDYVDPNANNPFGGGGGYYEEGNLRTRDVAVRGDIGPIRQFDDREAVATGYDDADFGSSSINVTAKNDEGSGLVIFQLDKSIFDLPQGETRLTNSGDDFGGTYVQLCSDTHDGSVHFDGMAEEAVIVVTDRGEARDVTIDATIVEGWDGASYDNPEPTVVSSSFTVLR